MKPVLRKSALSIALTLGLFGGTTWSASSYACSPDPYLSDVCVMALVAGQYLNGFNEYLPAAGQVLPVSQYQALYALIGNTYGGSGTTSFALPDMRGRVVVGAGTGVGLPTYPVGQKGGSVSIQLTSAQLPPHVHTLNTNPAIQPPNARAAVTGAFTATTTLSGLTTTTNLAGVTFSAPGAGLTLNGSNGGNLSNSPSNASLGTTLIASAKTYSDAAPTPAVAMKANSIGGTVSGTLSGTAPGTATGTATTTISGSPTVTISGSTDVAGASAAVPIMPPYLPMYYFIAVQGMFPQSN